jgi:hypothetical protein
MRQCGFPGWQVCGLETFGILGVNRDSPGPGNSDFGTFEVTEPTHFLYQGLNLTKGQQFAKNMVGHESDIRVTTLDTLRKAAGNDIPDGADDPKEPAGITTLAEARGGNILEGLSTDYFLQSVPVNAVKSVADLIYWDRPEGGRVFNAGAVGNGIALLHDEKFAKLVYNVLLRFL